jgi:hypothetical protein
MICVLESGLNVVVVAMAAESENVTRACDPAPLAVKEKWMPMSCSSRSCAAEAPVRRSALAVVAVPRVPLGTCDAPACENTPVQKTSTTAIRIRYLSVRILGPLVDEYSDVQIRRRRTA